MTQVIAVLMLLIASSGGGYYLGMRHYDVASKDAAIEALATSITKTVKVKDSHKRAREQILDRLQTERMAWRIYENDNLDRCARTPVNDPRLVRLLLGLSEDGRDSVRMAAEGPTKADADTVPTVAWGQVGDYTIRLRTAAVQCNADKAAVVHWCELGKCVDPAEVLGD